MDIIADRSFMENTFLIKVDIQTGTAYCLTKGERQYLVTARHILPKNKHKDAVKISIWKNETWNDVDTECLLHDEPLIDIAVLPLKGFISQPYDVVIGTEGMGVGFETFFFGYPYQMSFTHSGINNGFPIPLVKRATISGFHSDKSKASKPYTIFLDGINNPGFSGGPIGHHSMVTRTTYLYGFISGFQSERKEIVTPMGKFPYEQNTGIIVAYAADHALQIIDKETAKK